MNQSIKLRNSIVQSLDKIKADTFDESTIKTLLIDIREYIKDKTILRELADFIAHPRRDRGLSHKLLNSRYTKLTLVEQQLKKIEAEDGWRNINTEWGYSHAVLSAISVDRIKSSLFKILFIDGIEDISEATLKQYYKLGKKEIIKILETSYFESDGHHILKNLKLRTQIEDLLKFLRGTVSGKSAFEENAMIKDLEGGIRIITRTFDIPGKQVELIKTRRKEIVLCIMCLMHDARLTFHDGHEAKLFLSTSEGRLTLESEGTIFQFSVFASSLLLTDYLEPTDETFRDREPIPWINARRNPDGKLILCR